MRWIGLLICLASGNAGAQTGFYLPTSNPSYGQDEFRASDGTTCRSTMDGTKRIEVGTFGSAGRQDNVRQDSYYGLPGYASSPQHGNAGVYGRFSMSLDARPDRMDCNKLFELELEKKRLEVEVLKRSLGGADRRLDELRSQAPVPSRKAKVARGVPPP